MIKKEKTSSVIQKRNDLLRLRDKMFFIYLFQAGYSPLHQAATEGHEEVVKLLLKSGCHVDTQDELVSDV